MADKPIVWADSVPMIRLERKASPALARSLPCLSDWVQPPERTHYFRASGLISSEREKERERRGRERERGGAERKREREG